MRDVFLIAGHTDVPGLDRGAPNPFTPNRPEGVSTVEFRDLIIAECRKLGIQVKTDSNRNALRETLAWLRTITFRANDILIDIHFDSVANPNAHGTSVFIPNNPSKFERDFGQKLLNIFVKEGFANRGVRTENQSGRGTLGIMRPNLENILLEVCFISNKSDIDRYEARKHTLAKNVALLIKEYVNPTKERVHIVKPGDNLWRIAVANNTTMDALMRKNNLPNNTIRVGQRIIL